MRLGKVQQEIMDTLRERDSLPARDIAYYMGRHKHGSIDQSVINALKSLMAQGLPTGEKGRRHERRR